MGGAPAAEAATARPPEAGWPGWRTLAAVLLLYLAAVVIATYPAITTCRGSLPAGFTDPLIHIWTLRWYRTCLADGRLPFRAPDVQYPTGAPLGLLPPLQYQALLYLPLSALIDNDILCYNLIWYSSFLLTGIGGFLLAWWVLRDRRAAALAGLLAMLCGPMTIWSQGQVEQITLGWLPLFLVAWLRFVDRPSRGRLAAAAGLYLLLAMSAPYYGIFGVFPAALYLAWAACGAWRRGERRWLRARTGWLAAFAGITAPAVAVLFSSQVWAMVHGYSLVRSDREFDTFRATLGSYLIPEPRMLLYGLLPGPVRAWGAGDPMRAYLGAVTVGLLVYAAACRVRFPRALYWWAALAMLVVLSMGPRMHVLGRDIPLPAQGLRQYGLILRLIRVPGRFSFFAAVVAAVIAGAALRHILGRLSRPAARAAVFAALAGLAVADLALVPYNTTPVPPVPAGYDWLTEHAPGAAVLVAPHHNYTQTAALSAYWQTLRGGRTSAGCTAEPNLKHEWLVGLHSPFHADRLADPAYLADPEDVDYGLARRVRFVDQAWLYLAAHGFDYVVLHHRPADYPEVPVHLDRLRQLLAPAEVHADDRTIVYARDRLAPPSKPVALTTEGWRGLHSLRGRAVRGVERVGRLVVYNPDAGRPLVLAVEASAFRGPRRVLLRRNGEVLAEWDLQPGEDRTLLTPPLHLPAGLHRLELVSDRDARPPRRAAQFADDRAPISLCVSALGAGPTAETAASWDHAAPRLVSAERAATRR